MSALPAEWDAKLKAVGPGVKARRLFGQLSSTSSSLKNAKTAIAAGMKPVLSCKVPNNDWAGVASGKYDPQLKTLHTNLVALNGWVFITLHHEPAKDGAAKDWANMLLHALPILKGGSTAIQVGVIGNGWWWSKSNQGYTDAEIAQYIPPALRTASDIIASDCYQMSATGEDSVTKIKRMSEWADRVGVTKLGIGEYNGMTAKAIEDSGTYLLSDQKFQFGCCWNSKDFTLTGDRLAAFKRTLAASTKVAKSK